MSKLKGICIFIILLGCAFRLYQLGNRENTTDEDHYHWDMRGTETHVKDWAYRDHSYNHIKGAPHGLIGPIFSWYAGKFTYRHFKSLYPKDLRRIENAFGRVGYAICGILTLPVFYLVALWFFPTVIALALTAIASILPLMVMWSRTEYLDGPMLLFVLASLYLLLSSNGAPSRTQMLKRGLSGVCLGLAVGTKWPALYLAPFWFLYYPLLQRRLNKEVCLSLLLIGLGFAAAVFFSHSPASLHYVFSINKSNSHYDPEVNSSISEKIVSGVVAIFQKNTLYAFLELHGLLLVCGVIGAVFLWLKRKSGLTPEKSFSLLFFFGATLALSILCACTYAEWRSQLFAYFEILIFGIFLSQIDSKRLFATTCLVLASILPFTVMYGLRTRKPKTYFHGVWLLHGMELGSGDWNPPS